MNSSGFYQRQTGSTPKRRSRAVVIDNATQPPRPAINPDEKPSELAKKSLKMFGIIVASMIAFMYISVKLLEHLWSRRDRQRAPQTAISTTPTEPAAILSTASPAPPQPATPPEKVTRPSVTEMIAAPPEVKPAISALDTSSATDKFRWGKLLEEQGELAGALNMYLSAIETSPEDPLVLSQAGRLYIRLARHAEAIPVLRSAHVLIPDNPDIMNDLGVALTFNGQAAEAVQLYEELSSSHPDYHAALFNQGYALVQLSDYEKARPLLEGYLAKEPENAMALGVLAILELAEKKYDEALALLDRAIAISPTWPTPYLDAAGIAAAKGAHARAVQYLEQALLIAAPAEVYQQYSSAAFRDIRTTDAGKELEKKIADEARKAMP